MLVQLHTIMAGPQGVYDAGSIAEFDESLARALIDGGYAVAVARNAYGQFAAVAPVAPDGPAVDAETADLSRRTRKGK